MTPNREKQLAAQRKSYALNREKYRREANERVSLRRERNQQWVVNYLNGKQCPCGVKDPRMLAFDHIDPSSKTANIADIISKGRKLETLKAEVEKCRVLCHNCHMLHTMEQNGGSYHDKMTPISEEDFNTKYKVNKVITL